MKKVDQVLPDGTVIEDYDQPLSTKEISELFYDLFGEESVLRGKQHVLFDQFGLLVANITYLGHPWPIYKKRIQLKSYYPEYYRQNIIDGIQTFLVGIYRYGTQLLFAIFDAASYMERKSHNSSAHVQTFDLQYAAMKGVYSKIDGNGNSVMVMDTDHFVNYFKELMIEGPEYSDFEQIRKDVEEYVANFVDVIPKGNWNGISCYKEMMESDAPNWRQGEWQGWYFEYLFKRFAEANPSDDIHYYADKRDGGIDFDIVFSEKNWIFGDLKADKEGDDILGNKFSSFDIVITEHNGKVFYIVLRYKSELDKNHGYKTTIFWNELRDPEKRYTTMEEIKSGYGVRMKYSVTPLSIRILSIDKTAYEILKMDPFRQGRNSNGQEREPKLRISKDMIDALSIYQINLE